MYGTLGFVENDRHANMRRDAGYLGTNGHPSRKELSGARRPEDQARAKLNSARPVAEPSPPLGVLDESSMVKRRCEFLEAQDKRHMAEIAELRAHLSEHREALECLQGAFVVTAVALAEAPSRADASGLPGDAVASVAQGTRVKLIYPMHKADGGVWMRRYSICADTAQITTSWLQLSRGDAPLVGDFALV